MIYEVWYQQCMEILPKIISIPDKIEDDKEIQSYIGCKNKYECKTRNDN